MIVTKIARFASRFRRSPKIFCVGRNKTGTTSLAAALRQLGYRLGIQQEGELLIEDWSRRDFRSLISYCRKSDAFQDSPFSRDYTFQAMDAAFPHSKFILSVRNSPEEWYESLIRFHRMRLRERTGEDRLPTHDDFKNDPYIYPGYLWRVRELVHGISDSRVLWDQYELVSEYLEHNRKIENYFRHRPDDLLVLNLSDENAMERLCSFLGKPWDGEPIPKLNISK